MNFVSASQVGQLEMTATNSNHFNSGKVSSQRNKMVSNTDMIESTVRPETTSFDQVLLKAFDEVNSYQQASSGMAEKIITDPDSVDVHDVTTAMAKASLSLSLTSTVLDRLVKGWNEITTTR